MNLTDIMQTNFGEIEMSYKKLISIIGITFLTVLLANSFTVLALPPPGEGYGGTYRVNILIEPKHFNAHVQYDWGAMSVTPNLFSRLVCTDWGVVYGIPEETGGIVADLATGWKVSDDGLTFTFDIYEDAKWSDGKPLTSADVVYTYNEILTNSKLRRHFWLKETMKVTSIEAPDDYTVVIKTSKFNPDWLVTFAQYSN
jgi:peptide/nickel transport system substrate-binding protein